MSEPLSAIIVGCGAIAGGYDETMASQAILTHAKAYRSHPNFRLLACVEPDESRRAHFMQNWDIKSGYARLEDVEGSFDVASLCAPTEFHAPVLEEMLNMPIGLVWAEKPLTSDLARSRAIVGAYQTAKRPVAVNYFRRWASEIQALAGEITDGQWGALQKATVFYVRGLLNNGGHAIDLLHFLFGRLRPVACLGRVHDGNDEDPTIDAQLATESGAPVFLLGADGRAFGLFEITLLFEGGRVTLTDSGFLILRQPIVDNPRFVGHRALAPSEMRASGLDRAMLAALDNISAHLAQGQILASDAASALATQEVCAALSELALQPA